MTYPPKKKKPTPPKKPKMVDKGAEWRKTETKVACV